MSVGSLFHSLRVATVKDMNPYILRLKTGVIMRENSLKNNLLLKNSIDTSLFNLKRGSVA